MTYCTSFYSQIGKMLTYRDKRWDLGGKIHLEDLNIKIHHDQIALIVHEQDDRDEVVKNIATYALNSAEQANSLPAWVNTQYAVLLLSLWDKPEGVAATIVKEKLKTDDIGHKEMAFLNYTRQLPFFLDTLQSNNLKQLEETLFAQKRAYGLDFLFMLDAHTLESPKSDKNFSDVIKRIKQISTDLMLPIIFTATIPKGLKDENSAKAFFDMFGSYADSAKDLDMLLYWDRQYGEFFKILRK